MSDDKKWHVFDKAAKIEEELKKSEEYKIFENFLNIKMAFFGVRYNFNQYCKHIANFEQRKLIAISGIKRWHQQKITSILISNYFSACYSFVDIMEHSGYQKDLKEDLFIKLTRELRNFMLHREVLPITNNERHWRENDQIYFKSQVTTPSEIIKQYLDTEKSKMKSLIDFFEKKSYERIPLSDIIFDLKNVMEDIFAAFKSQFILTNKEALIILEVKYKEISQMISESDMSHYKAAGIKYRYLRLLLFVYCVNK
jgi:hypothetical protein